MKRVKFGGSVHFPENAQRKWPKILHADVSWPPSEMFSSGLRYVDFCNFGTIFTQWNGSNLGFPGISWTTHEGNGLTFWMLMYLDHLQNWLFLGHGLLIFVILALFWLSETGQIWGFRAFPREPIEGMAWNVVCYCILTTFRTDLAYGWSLVIFLLLVLFWLNETGQTWGFQAFSGKPIEEWPEILHADVSWPFTELIRL